MHIHANQALLFESEVLGKSEIRRMKWDTWSGMFYSNIAAYFIILATGVTLHVSGIQDITTAAQAAQALKPLAGEFAYLLFALGIVAVGLIAVPVLAGSAAYALSEVFGWKSSLEDSVMEDKKFYFILTVSVLSALVIQYLPINPMKALFWSAVINGVVAVPLMVAVVALASKISIMGQYVAPKSILAIAWFATALMAIAVLFMFIAW
jgi:Mn2+/Fe2+ NRAMP family transporter